MKTIYSFSMALLVLIAAASCTGSSQAQQENTGNFSNVMESKNYVFVAQNANPLGGRTRQLTTEYDLRVYGDSVIAFLPYFGRAYSAPVNPTQGGIQFTSTNFDYTQTPRKKGGWNISIRPKDVQDVRELTLIVAEGGNASLQVISNARQAISFNGYVAPRK